MKQKISKTTRQLMNCAEITDHSLVTLHGDELAYFLFTPSNLAVLSRDNIQLRIESLVTVLKSVQELELVCLNGRESFATNRQFLQQRLDEEENMRVQNLLEQDLDHFDKIQIKSATAREFALCVRMRGNKEKDTLPYLQRVERIMRDQQLSVRKANGDDIKRMLAVYFAQDVTSEQFADYDGQQFGQEKNGRKTFFDLIAPSAIKFEQGQYICGNTYRSVWALNGYPSTTQELALLQHLGEKAGVNMRAYFRLVNATEERQILQNADKANKLKRSNTNSIQDMVEAESNLQDVASVIATAHRNREPFLHVAVYLELVADSPDALHTLQDEVMAELSSAKLNVDRLLLRQKDGFASVMPPSRHVFAQQFERVLPAGSAANLYPFSYSGKTDPHGFFIGRDKYGSNVIVDFDRRTDDRTTSSVLILGNSGQGKSYLLKLLILTFLESGKNGIIFDPENETQPLIESVGGSYLNLADGTTIINVLEPKRWNDESDKKLYILSQHISFLRDFFKAYKDFTQAQLDTIELLLQELYARFGISDETDFSLLTPVQYPTLSDFYSYIESVRLRYETLEKPLYSYEMLQVICSSLQSLCIGAESKPFNGHTNIASTKIVAFGLKDILDTSSENMRNAILFNTLSYVSHELLTTGNTVAFFEELHVFLSNPTAIGYIRGLMKRVRKRDSAIVLASQNINDFLLPEIAEFTKPLFSIPTYQFLFHPGTVNGAEYRDALQLEQNEYDIITSCRRGNCLFKCGTERYNLLVKVPEYKAKMFGGGGGR